MPRGESVPDVAYRVQKRVAMSMPWAGWGRPVDPPYAAAQAVGDSVQVADAVRGLLRSRVLPTELRDAARDALSALGALERLRPGWLAHWEYHDPAARLGTDEDEGNALRRAAGRDFPSSAAVQSWPDVQRAEEAMLTAAPVMDRLQRVLAGYTGIDFEDAAGADPQTLADVVAADRSPSAGDAGVPWAPGIHHVLAGVPERVRAPVLAAYDDLVITTGNAAVAAHYHLQVARALERAAGGPQLDDEARGHLAAAGVWHRARAGEQRRRDSYAGDLNGAQAAVDSEFRASWVRQRVRPLAVTLGLVVVALSVLLWLIGTGATWLGIVAAVSAGAIVAACPLVVARYARDRRSRPHVDPDDGGQRRSPE